MCKCTNEDICKMNTIYDFQLTSYFVANEYGFDYPQIFEQSVVKATEYSPRNNKYTVSNTYSLVPFVRNVTNNLLYNSKDYRSDVYYKIDKLMEDPFDEIFNHWRYPTMEYWFLNNIN